MNSHILRLHIESPGTVYTDRDGTVTVGPLGSYLPAEEVPEFFDFSSAIDTWNAKSGSDTIEIIMSDQIGMSDPFHMFNITGWPAEHDSPYACGRNYVPRSWWPD